MLIQNKIQDSYLRGGGCGIYKLDHSKSQNSQADEDQDEQHFFSGFNNNIHIIYSKAKLAANEQQSNEIMKAIQWFVYQEECIYNLIKSIYNVKKSYDLILEGITYLLKSCLFYIRTDCFKCFYILQITTSLSKVIFSFHLMNEQRYMKFVTKHELIDICDEIKQQIDIEKNDLIQNQMEHYIFLTKSSFEMAPNNEVEKNDSLKGCLKGILQSLIKVSIDSDLLESLFKGACLLYKMYDINKKRKQYEVYFQIDILQWELINYFKKNKQQNIQEIISHMEAIYEKLVKNSNNWNDHYCWIQLIGNILVYNPKINQKRLCLLSQKFQYLGLTSNQIWKDYINQKILINVINSKDWAIIQLNQLNNQKLKQTDKLILQECFYGWENFILFKEYLMDDQSIIKQSNNLPSFESYLKNKLNLGNQNSESNEDFLNVNTIQKFLSFIISNQLLKLIGQNYENLSILFKNMKNLMKKYNLNIKITQRTFSQQIQTNISYLQEYFQNVLNIMKIYNLYLNEKNIQNNLNKNIKNQEMIYIQQLTYFMRLTEYLQQEYINEIQERNNEKSGLQQSNNEIDEIFLKENEIIEQEIYKLTKIKFQQKTQQIVNNFYQKLLTLSKVFQDKQKLKQRIIKFTKIFRKFIKINENCRKLTYLKGQFSPIFSDNNKKSYSILQI